MADLWGAHPLVLDFEAALSGIPFWRPMVGEFAFLNAGNFVNHVVTKTHITINHCGSPAKAAYPFHISDLA